MKKAFKGMCVLIFLFLLSGASFHAGMAYRESKIKYVSFADCTYEKVKGK